MRAHAPFLAVCMSIAIPGATDVRADDSAGRMRGSVSIARIIIDAYMTDPSGEPIPDLSAADFRVMSGRRELEVESAEWIPAGKSEGPDDPLASSSAEPAKSAWPIVRYPPGRLIVVLMQGDIGRQRTKGLMRVRAELWRLLETVTPTDRVAVVRFDSHLTLLCDFTSRRSALDAALDEGLLQGTKPTVVPSPFPSLAERLDVEAARRAASVEQALDLVARALAPIPGGKALVFLGWGVGIDGSPRESIDYAHALATMAAARITVFTLDVSDADWHTLETGLQTTSALTGGTYAKTHIFPNLAVRRVARSLSGRYVLVCVAPDDGILTGLEVSLRRRRGEVVTRAYTSAP